MKVALVYDRVNKLGGAERVLKALRQIWPEAPLFTSVYDEKGAPWAKKFKVIPSFLQKLPWAREHHEFYPCLTPLGFESFSFKDFDLVISVTSAEAKGILTLPETCHICYCLTPTRYLWVKPEEYLKNPGFGPLNNLARLAFRISQNCLKKWDRMAASRPDFYLAISQRVKKRIKKYYGQEAEVIYPPVDIKKVKSEKLKVKSFKNEYFLIVSRLVAYKRVDLAIKAFNQLKLPLKIVGAGALEKPLKKMAGDKIEFLGQLTDRQLLGYYQHCTALIMPQEEDFGLVALEAQACGKPVITFKESGAAEVIKVGETGEVFKKQKLDSLIKVVKNFRAERYQPKMCRENAQKYSLEVFKKRFERIVQEKWRIYDEKN